MNRREQGDGAAHRARAAEGTDRGDERPADAGFEFDEGESFLFPPLDGDAAEAPREGGRVRGHFSFEPLYDDFSSVGGYVGPVGEDPEPPDEGPDDGDAPVEPPAAPDAPETAFAADDGAGDGPAAPLEDAPAPDAPAAETGDGAPSRALREVLASMGVHQVAAALVILLVVAVVAGLGFWGATAFIFSDARGRVTADPDVPGMEIPLVDNAELPHLGMSFSSSDLSAYPTVTVAFTVSAPGGEGLPALSQDDLSVSVLSGDGSYAPASSFQLAYDQATGAGSVTLATAGGSGGADGVRVELSEGSGYRGGFTFDFNVPAS